MNEGKLEISYKTILFAIAAVFLTWILLQVSEVILLFFVAFLLMSAFRPAVDSLSKLHIPRILCAFMVYILFMVFLGIVVFSLVPPFISESAHFADRFPTMINTVLPFMQVDTSVIAGQIAPLSRNLIGLTLGIFSNIAALFTVIVVSFYLVLERVRFQDYFRKALGVGAGDHWFHIVGKVEQRLGVWIRGQVILGLVIAIITFIALSILGIPYALPLAILAGILEIIPMIGPIISMIPALFLALTISPILGLLTVGSYILIQQTESHVLVPLVMRQSVGLPPVVTIFSFMLGAKLGGFAGALLAIPILVTLTTLVSEYLHRDTRVSGVHADS